MCDCYSQVKAKLRDHVGESLPEGSRDLDVEMEGYVFGIGASNVTHRAAFQVKTEYFAPKKGGGEKRVRSQFSMRASFCPFCGKNYDEETPATE